MAMADEQELHRCVTKFMIDTCRCTGSNVHTFHRRALRAYVEQLYGTGKVNAVITGSSVEFYIDPILPCVDDVDIMHSDNDTIAVPAGQSPPPELPAHFHSEVRAYEVEDSDWPGYVCLRSSYNMKRYNGRYRTTRNLQFGFIPHSLSLIVDTKLSCPFSPMFNLVDSRQDTGRFKSILMELFLGDQVATERHGPAENCQVNLRMKRFDPFPQCHQQFLDDVDPNKHMNYRFDCVFCVRCLFWPVQAADWPTRYREHGWPVSATIDTVVSNGCDVVQAVHPHCRQDEWMSKHQWRFSFSRAEVTLLNSWTQLQQIAYHMLRFIIKKEIISVHESEFPNVPTISNYHIKTLMLWACEQKSQNWWSPESCVVKLCSKLMHELADMVCYKRCPHYFVSNCNIADFLEDLEIVYKRLERIGEESVLLHWFVDNYIIPCVQKFPEKASLLKDIPAKETENETIGLDPTVNNNVNDLRLLSRQCTYMDVSSIEPTMLNHLQLLQGTRVVLPGVSFLLNVGLAEAMSSHPSQRFRDYTIAVSCLHVAYNIAIHSLSHELLEFLCMMCEPRVSRIGDYRTVIIEPGITYGPLMRAIHLAKTSIACRNFTEKLHVEVSKAILHHSLLKRGENLDRQAPIVCMTNILLAVLHYNTGQYLTAIGHCKQLLNDRDWVACGLHRIQQEYVTIIDVNVDNMLGLIIFYNHIRKKILNPSKHSDVQLVFTTALLAHYVNAQSAMIVAKTGIFTTPSVCQLAKYHLCLVRTEQIPVSDVLLYKSVEPQLVNENQMSVGESVTVAGGDNCNIANDVDTSLLVSALEQVALEKLVVFRHNSISEMNSSNCSVANEFEELYLYKCGLLDECQQLCRTNLDIFLHGGNIPHPYMIFFPELLSLLDGDVVSLFGIIRLMHVHDGLPPGIWLQMLTNITRIACYAAINCPFLSLYLYVECHKKLGSHALNEMLHFVCTVYHQCSLAMLDLERLVVKLIYRSLKLYISTTSCAPPRHRRRMNILVNGTHRISS